MSIIIREPYHEPIPVKGVYESNYEGCDSINIQYREVEVKSVKEYNIYLMERHIRKLQDKIKTIWQSIHDEERRKRR